MRPSPEHPSQEGPPAAADAAGEGELDDAPNPPQSLNRTMGTLRAPKPQFKEDALADGVTLNLSLACEGCTGNLLVRIENATSTPPTLSTQKAFDARGQAPSWHPRRSMPCSWWSMTRTRTAPHAGRANRHLDWRSTQDQRGTRPHRAGGRQVPDEPPLPRLRTIRTALSERTASTLREEGIRGLACLSQQRIGVLRTV